MRPRAVIPLALLAAFLHPPVARAQWKQDGTPISAALSQQSSAVIASDGAGGAIIVWVDSRNGLGDIYAQRVNASGIAQWAADGVVICNAGQNQLTPSIASDGAGGAVIAWYDYRSTTNFDIYAQRINASGTVLWAANGLAVCTQTLNQDSPTIASDGAGGAIVTWDDWRNVGTSADIYAQRVNAAGAVQWAADGVPLCTAAAQQYYPLIVMDGTGGAIVTWQDYRSTSNFDIYAQRVNSGGVAQWAANGVALCAAASDQSNAAIIPDGAGGAIVAWADYRNGPSDIYAQRVNASGVVQWLANGVALCMAANSQSTPTLATDGAGGAIVAWGDYRIGPNTDIYSQRVSFSGHPLWTKDGVALCTASNDQSYPTAVSDGSGGAIVAWMDGRNGPDDIFAQRVDAVGAVQWGYDGMPFTPYASEQNDPKSVSDGAGGAIVSWSDYRAGDNDVYAQRIDGRYGYWGRPEPTLYAVKDVPNDQGGKVRLEWYASGRDVLNQQVISHYSIWRAIDQAAFNAASSAGVPVVTPRDIGPAFRGKAVQKEVVQATEYFWELIGTQDAVYNYAYSFNAPTSFDSTATNPATHRFRVNAHAYGSQYINWPSNLLSGRSVDNVAPPAPLLLSAQRSGGNVLLKWNGVHVTDLKKYTVYRATSTGVTPIPANFLADDNDTLLTDSTAPASALYYIVTATDIHQNQGAKSNEASVAAATGVGNTPPITALTVLQNSPNPFTGETRLQVGLPARGDIRVEIYDVAGRRVRDVLVPAQAKGWNTLRLDARDEHGVLLPSGVYFYRVHAGAETVTKKMVIAR